MLQQEPVSFVDQLIAIATKEWEFFLCPIRSIDDVWHLPSNGFDEPWKSRVHDYWLSVNRPDQDGSTEEPWSAAFISWCFTQAGAVACGDFKADETHSCYIDAIRHHRGASEKLRLVPPDAALARGDLIWNARGEGVIPTNYEEALARLDSGPCSTFYSHVDIITDVGDGWADSVGGNVWNVKIGGGAVVKTRWALGGSGALADDRKPWIGVVKNSL